MEEVSERAEQEQEEDQADDVAQSKRVIAEDPVYERPVIAAAEEVKEPESNEALAKAEIQAAVHQALQEPDDFATIESTNLVQHSSEVDTSNQHKIILGKKQ